MTDATLNFTAAPPYRGRDRPILGLVLAVITFWLFAQTTLNVAPTMRDDLHISNSASYMAVSIVALFSGTFIVVAGGLADRFGRVRLTYIHLGLGMLGPLLIDVNDRGIGTPYFAQKGPRLGW